MIDLRSDTVTLPSAAMRAAMAEARVGDDQYGEDPSVNALQQRVAAMLGKEAALFVPSGTMANQIALKILTSAGDEVVVGDEAHVVWHEAGAASANAGVQFSVVGHGGLFTADDVARALKPRDHIVFPATALVVVENTHNRGGGVVFPQADVTAICATASRLRLNTYLDGARLFNAAVATGRSLAELAAPFDVVSIALSKGLGCPVGSVIAGRTEHMHRARRVRRMFGGALRQSGVLAAAGLYHHIERLVEDHANAKLLADRLAPLRGIELDLATVQTNIIIFRMAPEAPDAATLVRAARERGVLISAFGLLVGGRRGDLEDEQPDRVLGVGAVFLIAVRIPCPGGTQRRHSQPCHDRLGPWLIVPGTQKDAVGDDGEIGGLDADVVGMRNSLRDPDRLQRRLP
jgi:threonine aldolase